MPLPTNGAGNGPEHRNGPNELEQANPQQAMSPFTPEFDDDDEDEFDRLRAEQNSPSEPLPDFIIPTRLPEEFSPEPEVQDNEAFWEQDEWRDASEQVSTEPEPEPTSHATVESEPAIQPNFTDEKSRKLLPFGGNRSKASGPSEEDLAKRFDSREDRRVKARLVQGGVLTLLVGIVLFGGYNAINPPQGVSATEMNNAITQAIVTQNFPQERGSAFAEDFLNTYLSYDALNPDSDLLLNYYYTGTLSGEAAASTATYGDASQRVIVPAKTFAFHAVADNSASYTVGALVQPYDPNATVDPSVKIDPATAYKWVYYNVNVYYDDKTDTMAVTPDSPSLMPDANFGAAQDLPTPKTLGTGETNDELNDAVRSSLYGYLEAFAKSSPTSHDTLDQYLIRGGASGPELIQGLDDKFQLAGDPSSAVQYTAYTDTDPNVAKLDVSVTWSDKSFTGSSGSITYQSHYYIEMHKQANGQWLVATFAPRYYVTAPANS